MNLSRKYLLLWLILLTAIITGCTESVHASIWIEKFPASTDSSILKATLNDLGWSEVRSTSSGEVIFRNPSLPNCFLRQEPTKSMPVEIVFVEVGTDRFGPTEIAAYQNLIKALIAALGEESLRIENINAKV